MMKEFYVIHTIIYGHDEVVILRDFHSFFIVASAFKECANHNRFYHVISQKKYAIDKNFSYKPYFKVSSID